MVANARKVVPLLGAVEHSEVLSSRAYGRGLSLAPTGIEGVEIRARWRL